MGEQDTRPNNHIMWFKGEYPCRANVQQMSHVVNSPNHHIPFGQFSVDFYLLNKLNGRPPTNFYDKVTHYHHLFVSEAGAVDPNADGDYSWTA